MTENHHRKPDEPIVFLAITLQEAQWLQSGLADLLQWVRGWNAAAGERAVEHAPMGVDECRELNILLKRHIERTERRT